MNEDTFLLVASAGKGREAEGKAARAEKPWFSCLVLSEPLSTYFQKSRELLFHENSQVLLR